MKDIVLCVATAIVVIGGFLVAYGIYADSTYSRGVADAITFDVAPPASTVTPSEDDLKKLEQLPSVDIPCVTLGGIVISKCDWGSPYYHRGDKIESSITVLNSEEKTVNTARADIVVEKLAATNGTSSTQWIPVGGTTYYYDALNLHPNEQYTQNISFTIPHTYNNQSTVGTYRLNIAIYTDNDEHPACSIRKEVNIL